jgi:hypothetical protein
MSCNAKDDVVEIVYDGRFKLFDEIHVLSGTVSPAFGKIKKLPRF